MPYRLELSYKHALGGMFAKRDTTYTPFDSFFLTMCAMVTKHHVYTPEIDFKNNKHIENIRQLLCLTRDEYLVKKVILELDDSDSRKEITEGFCELAFIPKILAQITDKADVDLTVGKGKDKNEAEGGMSGLTSEDIDKILDEADAEIEIEEYKKMLESEALYIVAIFPQYHSPTDQLINYKGKDIHSFIKSELEKVMNGEPRKSDIPVKLLESFHELHNIFGSSR
ncbi:MAG: hypothetical protein IH795_03520 [Bacteroidetes bacterium]|nr:hypothetical protein [Bacteroidota bacterium]